MNEEEKKSPSDVPSTDVASQGVNPVSTEASNPHKVNDNINVRTGAAINPNKANEASEKTVQQSRNTELNASRIKIPSNIKWLSLRETALILGVNEKTVRNWKKKGLFVPDHKDHDGRLFYSRAQVEQLKTVYHKDWNKVFEQSLKSDVDETRNIALEQHEPSPHIVNEPFKCIPASLKVIPRWLLHKGKVPKIFNTKSKNPRPNSFDCTKSGSFLDFNVAVNALSMFGNKVDGIGFALDKSAINAVCIDIDDTSSDISKRLLDELKSTYIELSLSGKGYHIWFLDRDLSTISGRRIDGLEIYADKHFLSFTGNKLPDVGAELAHFDGFTKRLLLELFDNSIDDSSIQQLIANTDFDAAPNIPDDHLLNIIKNSNDFEAKKLLIEGNPDGYKSLSEADWHLVLKLCFWTNGNAGQIERLCYQSPLADRDKWQDRLDYRRRTIVKALAVWDQQGYKSADSVTNAFKISVGGDIFEFHNPPRFAVNLSKGIFKFDDAGECKSISNDVILPLRLFSNADNYSMKVELGFRQQGLWRRSIFDYDFLTIAKNIVELGKLGLDVTSVNARDMISFFRDFIAVNRNNIPIVTAFSQTGWRLDGSFIYPVDNNRYIIDAGRDINLLDMFKPHGDRDAWINTYNKFKVFPFFRLAVAASLAAPTLKILTLRNMTIQFWSQSGEGKTAILKFADSVFKNPVPLLKFSATKSHIEARCVSSSDFPICVDELKTADLSHKSASIIDVFAHLIEAGASKGRATKDVFQRAIKSFRTIAIITGEHPLSSFNSDMGIKRRVLELHSTDIFKGDNDAAFFLHQFAEDNYGLVGQDWINIISDPNFHDEIKSVFASFKSHIIQHRPDAFIDHCNLLAACATADFFFNREIAAPDSAPDSHILLDIEQDFSIEQQQKDSVSAFEFLSDWIAKNQGMFAVDGKTDVHAVKYGWLVERGKPDEAFAIIPTVVKQALEDAGFNPNKVLKELADDGLIESHQQKNKKTPDFTVVQWIKQEGVKRVIKVFSSKFNSLTQD